MRPAKQITYHFVVPVEQSTISIKCFLVYNWAFLHSYLC